VVQGRPRRPERDHPPLCRLLFEGPGETYASPNAAVAAAAHTVLFGVIPSFGTPSKKVAALAIVEDAYLRALSRVSDGAAKTKGAAMLAPRKDDSATRDVPYTPGTGPGKWRPQVK
jgi:hypothetical protein